VKETALSQNDEMQEPEETLEARGEGEETPEATEEAAEEAPAGQEADHEAVGEGEPVLEVLPPEGEEDEGGEDEAEEVVEVIDMGGEDAPAEEPEATPAAAKPTGEGISGIPASKIPRPGMPKKPARPVDPNQLRAIQEQLGASLRSAREEAAAAQDRVAELEVQLAAKEQEWSSEREEMRNKMMRAVADKDNYRKRAEREKAEAKLYSAKPLVSDLLQAVDNLERALAHAERTQEDSSISEGVRMVHRQILTALERNGVKGFDSLGQPFDPQRHEAVQQRESTEHATGTVIEEFQRGYFIHERLLRAALVVVARYVGVEEPPAADEAATLTDAPPPPGSDEADASADPPEATEEVAQDEADQEEEVDDDPTQETAAPEGLGDDVSEAQA
jgi:molecular chaperone GrpE